MRGAWGAGESAGRRRGHFLPSPEGGQCMLLIKFQGEYTESVMWAHFVQFLTKHLNKLFPHKPLTRDGPLFFWRRV